MRTVLYFILSAFLLLPAACSKESKSTQQPTGKGGSMARFALAGNYLYVVNTTWLHVYDVSENGQPVIKNKVNAGWNIETIFAYDNKLFLGSSSALYIFSLNDPVTPVWESGVTHLRSCDPVVTQGNTAFVTLRGGSTCGGTTNALMVYDVTDIKAPALKASIPMKGPYGLGVQDSALYVCDGADGLTVFDIKSPHAPRKLQTIEGGDMYIDVIPYNGVLIAYVRNGVRFFDISKPQEPVLLSALMD
ncbi:LVIVD repeat-containing protein [Chitinophaga cymbidii]|nr:hypothetical protein [Chitinophaga cymbidii]